tara:strand:- start:245 stop:1345 length:1101 start_codon:yes stop_codon:yes gene_type:complete
MARNRVIYQSEALYVSENASSEVSAKHLQLERVQSANFSYTINRQDINQFGELARIDSIIMDPPTVSTDFTYYLTDGLNERALGFSVETGIFATGNKGVSNFASGQMISSSGFNAFIVTAPEGVDINTDGAIGADDTVIGIGNCYLTDYSVDMSVGSIPTASVSVEGANVRSDVAGGTIDTPAVDQEAGTALTGNISLPTPSAGGSAIKALRPGDIEVTLTNFDGDTVADLVGTDGAHVQSVGISLPLSRSPIDRLGSRFPFAREVDFPVNVSMSISAIVNETTAFQLADKLDASANSAKVTMKDKNGDPALIWELSGAKVDSESFSTSIGSNQSVDLTLSAQVGGINDVTNGLFLSGSNTTEIYG